MAQGQRREVGRFAIDEAGHLWGPKEYLEEQGNAKLDKILSGKDEVFNMTAGFSPNIEIAVLVALQTDYAGWKGMREALSWCKPRKQE